MSRHPRILLIAEAANPQWTSVPLVGWSHSQALREVADVHLVTHVRNREAILNHGLVEDRDFTAIDSEAVARPLHRLSSTLRGGSGKGWTTVTAFASLAYYYFEHLVWEKFGARLRAGEFDMVHRLTPLSPTTPSRIARRCRRIGVPFVLGPLNGGVPWPREFDAARRKEKEWLSYLRAAHRLMPGYRATRRHADAILIGSQATWQQMPDYTRDRCVYIPENGIDPTRFQQQRAPRDSSEPLRAVFLGRLVPYKGPDMLLEAAAPLVREGRLRVDVIGDGPLRGELASIIQREQIDAGVTLHGWVEHAALQDHLTAYDVLAFPSIREFGGGVALEAMALGLVPIVVDYGGPAELVTDDTGYRIPLGDRARLIARFREALTRIERDPEDLERRSAAARRRVHALFTWRAKAAQVSRVYQWVLGHVGERPDFGMPLHESKAPPAPPTAVESHSPDCATQSALLSERSSQNMPTDARRAS